MSSSLEHKFCHLQSYLQVLPKYAPGFSLLVTLLEPFALFGMMADSEPSLFLTFASSIMMMALLSLSFSENPYV